MTKIKSKILFVLGAIFILPIITIAQINSVNSVNSNVSAKDSVAVPTTLKAGSVNNDVTTKTTISNTSITNVTNSLNTVKDVSKNTQAEIKAQIESDIHDSIILIREQKDIEAYKLQNSVSEVRNNLYQEIDNSLGNILDTNTKNEIQPKIETAITSMEKKLTEVSGIKVDFSTSRQSVINILDKYQESLNKNEEVVKTPEIDLMNKDSDFDGLSDYDEEYIYGTDPKNARTVTGELTDGEKVAKGIDPVSKDSDKINYEDPINNTEAHVTKLYTVNEVNLVKDENKAKGIEFKGQALPNSYITLYIFSTPIIVAVKTDEKGEWSYTLDKELENGNHEIVVATVNNSGKILAKGNTIPFTKTADAAVFGSTGIGNDSSAGSGNFFQENYLLIIFGIFLAAIVITLIFTGNKKNKIAEINSNIDSNDKPL